MKALKLRESNKEDSLRLTFEGEFNPQRELEQELAPLFLSIETYANGWMPDIVTGKHQRKYSRSSIWKALKERRDENTTESYFYRTTWPALYMSLDLYFPPLSPEWRTDIEVEPLMFFAEAERCHKFVEMVRNWASQYGATYASAHSIADKLSADFPYFGRDLQIAIRDGFDKIYTVYWLNVFGPQLVELVGRERMLSTPAYRVEELPNGSILIVLWPTPTEYASDEARLVQARAHVHLRPELDFDTVLRTLRERSASLAPVEPRFHPDLAPFFSLMVDNAALHERQRKIAELNAYQPPEPEEWLPAASALPSDVSDPARALERYSLFAEQLVALLHTKVPSVFEQTPESLADVDYQFWREDYPRIFEWEHIEARAVPAIGGYLGEVLVRHLGGRWIPRQKLEEAQVLVGPRVWFPFRRALRSMRSSQAHLDSSLIQLYRVAERHRD